MHELAYQKYQTYKQCSAFTVTGHISKHGNQYGRIYRYADGSILRVNMERREISYRAANGFVMAVATLFSRAWLREGQGY